MTRMAGSAMASLFGDFGSPDFGQVGAQGMASRARQNLAADSAIAGHEMAKKDAEFIEADAEAKAAAIRSGAAAAQQSSIGSMLGSALPSIGGLFSSGGGGGGSGLGGGASSAFPLGTDFNLGDYTPQVQLDSKYTNLFKGI